MLIGFDASRAFVSQPTGTENYSYQLLKAFAKLDCQQRFCLYLRPNQNISEADRSWLPKGWKIKIIPWDYFWTQGGLALETWQNPMDVLFIPAHVIPFLKNPKVPVVTTAHDLPLEFFPHQKTLIQRIYLNRWVENLRARLAAKIIAVSMATKKDLIEKLGVPESKIKVVHEGVEYENIKYQIVASQDSLRNTNIKDTDQKNASRDSSRNAKMNEIRKKYGVEGDYFLFVGTIHPRKNLIRLIEAFGCFVRSAFPSAGGPLAELQLILVGRLGWDYQGILDSPQKLGIGNQVKFLNYVDLADLPYLYAGSLALVYPSLYEGFGLPILEAYSAGTLVLTSNISSMPEVGGSEAIYVNPFDVLDIERGLRDAWEINQKPEIRLAKIGKGREWAKGFTWEKTAQQTLEVLNQSVNLKGLGS